MKKTLWLLPFCCFILTACGKKGPLYLPDPNNPKKIVTQPAVTQGEPTSSTKNVKTIDE